MDSKICLICGMKISEKNYEYNKEAMINKNSTSTLEVCPFCGVKGCYITGDEESFLSKNYSLDDDTLRILDHAMKLEVFNSDFYKKASRMAEDENVREMLSALSRVELMHARIHQKLGGFTELPVLQQIDYSKYKGDRILLGEAKKREEHAVAYYEKYSPMVSDRKLIEVLNALAEVEKAHIDLILK